MLGDGGVELEQDEAGKVPFSDEVDLLDDFVGGEVGFVRDGADAGDDFSAGAGEGALAADPGVELNGVGGVVHGAEEIDEVGAEPSAVVLADCGDGAGVFGPDGDGEFDGGIDVAKGVADSGEEVGDDGGAEGLEFTGVGVGCGEGRAAADLFPALVHGGGEGGGAVGEAEVVEVDASGFVETGGLEDGVEFEFLVTGIGGTEPGDGLAVFVAHEAAFALELVEEGGGGGGDFPANLPEVDVDVVFAGGGDESGELVAEVVEGPGGRDELRWVVGFAAPKNVGEEGVETGGFDFAASAVPVVGVEPGTVLVPKAA